MQTMKAAILESAPGGLRIEEIPIPEPRAGEVLVKVSACGVCHTDLHVMKAEVAFPTPAVMGHEMAHAIARHGSQRLLRTTLAQTVMTGAQLSFSDMD